MLDANRQISDIYVIPSILYRLTQLREPDREGSVHLSRDIKRILEDLEGKVKGLPMPKGTTHLHERDFTQTERLVFHEYNRVFPDRQSMTHDAIRAHLPLCRAMHRIFFMRSFDVFATIFVPMWMGLSGDPECEWEGLFWHLWCYEFDKITRILVCQMEESQHLTALFGEHWVEEELEIPNEDPRWQQHNAYMAKFRAAYDAKHPIRRIP